MRAALTLDLTDVVEGYNHDLPVTRISVLPTPYTSLPDIFSELCLRSYR